MKFAGNKLEGEFLAKVVKNIVILRNEPENMKLSPYHLFISAWLALAPTIMPAADLPKLPTAPQIRTGVLDNGVSYYIVTNSTEKGKADVALVQRSGTAVEDDRTAGDGVVLARGSLSDLPHFMSLSPQRYLSRNAIWPSSGGYVTVGRDATVYHFDDITLSYSPDVVDSTMLMLFDIIDRADGPLLAPQNQAIVVSGDIDASALLNKMNMLSMLVTRREGFEMRRNYVWHDSDSTLVHHLPSVCPSAATLSVSYRSARTPEENMATVQPLVSWRYAREFCILVRKRLERAFRRSGIPVAGMDFRYRGSADGPDDELYTLRLSVRPSDYEEALRIVAGVFSDLDTDGSSADEYLDVRNELNMELRRDFNSEVVKNREYVDKCVSAFLYGSSLASSKSDLEFFLTRNMEPVAATELFNNYVGALLDPRRNLVLGVDTLLLSPDRTRHLFVSSWESRKDFPAAYQVSHGDTLSLKTPSNKIKLKTMAPEPLSGGQMWTFANGIRVIYKEVPQQGMFHYAWLLNGGFATLQGLRPGEGAWLSDLLLLDEIGDMKGSAFRAMLAANGITMTPQVTLTDFRISGAAPDSRLPLLFKSLLALAENRKVDMDAYGYYLRGAEIARHLEEDGIPARRAVLDSLLNPGNAFTASRRAAAPANDLPLRAERYFASRFANMADGVLIIVGHFDENALKKTLTQYLGGFRTDKTAPNRFRHTVKPPTGRAVQVTEGADAPRLDFRLTAATDYTVEHFIAANIAARYLSDAVADALGRRGWHSEAIWRFDPYPYDCFSLSILSSLADPDGMPASVMPEDSVGLVAREVRDVVARTAAEGIPDARLKACKTELVGNYNSWASDPETIISLLTLRYSFGKDILTNYSDKVAAVGKGQVDAVLKLLVSDASAAHVVRSARPLDPLHVSDPEPEEWPETAASDPLTDSLGIAPLYYELFGNSLIINRSFADTVKGPDPLLWLTAEDLDALEKAMNPEPEEEEPEELPGPRQWPTPEEWEGMEEMTVTGEIEYEQEILPPAAREKNTENPADRGGKTR